MLKQALPKTAVESLALKSRLQPLSVLQLQFPGCAKLSVPEFTFQELEP
jgi:hypothetical protein